MEAIVADLCYWAWQRHGVPADVIRRQRIEDLAAMFGADGRDRTPPDEESDGIPSPGGPRRGMVGHRNSGRDLIAERVAYLERRGPKPEAEYRPPGAVLAAGLISAHAPG